MTRFMACVLLRGTVLYVNLTLPPSMSHTGHVRVETRWCKVTWSAQQKTRELILFFQVACREYELVQPLKSYGGWSLTRRPAVRVLS